MRFRLLLLAASLIVCAAQAPEPFAGSWKLTMGRAAPCTITMADDGGITAGDGCTPGASLAHWKSTSDGIQLQTASGETYAVLRPSGTDYEGKTFADMRKLTLSR